jgi:hypothetical protein
MESERTVKMTTLIIDAGMQLNDLAKWPDSEATRTQAANTIKLLRKAFREDSYPRVFLYMSMCHIANDMYGSAESRHIKNSGLKAAWLQLGER